MRKLRLGDWPKIALRVGGLLSPVSFPRLWSGTGASAGECPACGAYAPSGSPEVRVGRRPRLAGRSYSLRREPAVKLGASAFTTLNRAQGRKPCGERKPVRWDRTCTQLCLWRSGAAARVCCSSPIRTHIHIHCMRWGSGGGKLFSLPRCRTPVSL